MSDRKTKFEQAYKRVLKRHDKLFKRLAQLEKERLGVTPVGAIKKSPKT